MGLLWLSRICLVVVGLSKNGIFPEKLKCKFTQVPLIINGILEQNFYFYFIDTSSSQADTKIYLDSE